MINSILRRLTFNNINNILRLSKIDEEVSVIGFVNHIRETKNNNFFLTLEDLTGVINVIIRRDVENLENIKTAEILLKGGALVNEKNNEGKTPFHYAGDSVNQGLIHLLFSYDVDLNAQDNEGKTPLHYAVVRGPRFIDIIEELVEKGADFKIKDKQGKTPLDIASEAGHKEIVELFRKKSLR